LPFNLIGDAIQHLEHAVLFAKDFDDGIGGVHAKGLKFPQ
jgi:hypothetical protein